MSTFLTIVMVIGLSYGIIKSIIGIVKDIKSRKENKLKNINNIDNTDNVDIQVNDSKSNENSNEDKEE